MTALPLETQKKRAPGKRWLIFGAVAAAVVLAVGGYSLLTGGKESTDDAQIEADIVPVAPRVPGQVKRLAVQDNQHVKKGDLILELDPADYAARSGQAQAELDTAAAQAAAADAQALVATAGVHGGFASAQASLQRAEAEERKAALELQRDRELRAQNVVPQSRLDDAEAAWQAARGTLSEARGKLDQSAPVKPAIAVAQANARLAHARERSAQAALELARLQLGYTKIYAQEDGKVTRLTAREGQMVQPGQPLASVVPDQTYVVANFKETQIGAMKPGQKVDVQIDAHGSRKLSGVVASIAGGTGSRFSLLPPDNASGNFVKVVQRVPVRIAWVDPPKELALLPGLSADVTVHVK